MQFRQLSTVLYHVQSVILDSTICISAAGTDLKGHFYPTIKLIYSYNPASI